jgi:hypothetical protein
MTARAPAARRLGLAGLLVAFVPAGCGTRVIELEVADAAAEIDAPVVNCQTEKGPNGPCLMCYYSDGKPLGGDCQPIGPPPCPANTGPIEGQCDRCTIFYVPGQSKINTCLTCKPWDKSTVPLCRTCMWTGIPLEQYCQQCTEANGALSDTCDELLKKLQAAQVPQ